MKTLLVSVISGCIAFSFSVASAQNNGKSAKNNEIKNTQKPTPEERADRQTKKLTKELSLTDGQVPKVKESLLNRLQTNEKDKERCKDDRDCLKLARRNNNASAEKQLKEILSKEQFEKLQKIRAEKRDKKRAEFEKQQGKNITPEKAEEELADSDFLGE
ncbi:MAG: hypothetical protein IT239_00440 [Bacteroidia bacterium]|nr:hypothetical protein [Bacteroidia bacterium]